MFRIVGSVLMVLAIIAGYAIAQGGDQAAEENTSAPAPATAEPAKNFNL